MKRYANYTSAVNILLLNRHTLPKLLLPLELQILSNSQHRKNATDAKVIFKLISRTTKKKRRQTTVLKNATSKTQETATRAPT